MAELVRVYSYVRFSKGEQKKGRSLKRQLEDAVEFCRRHKAEGFRLVEGMDLHDLGRSGYSGETLGPLGKLGQFLAAVEAGEVPPGSILLVESLDRLTRTETFTAILWFLNLLNKDIRVAVVSPVEKIYSKNDPHIQYELPILVNDLTRGHLESKMKSIRSGDNWTAKRQAAAEGKPMGGPRPPWITYNREKKKFGVDTVKAAIVLRIVNLAVAGHGTTAICKILNSEKVPHFLGGKRTWGHSYVHRLLTYPALVGEVQPMRRVGVKHIPTGDPVKGYYPAILEESQWLELKQVMRSRKRQGGPPSSNCRNLFVERVWIHGEPASLTTKFWKGKGYPYLRPTKALDGVVPYINVPYEPFESMMLIYFKEYLGLKRGGGVDNTAALTAEREDRLAKIAKLQERIESEEDSEDLIPVVQSHRRRIKELDVQLAEAKAKYYQPNALRGFQLIEQLYDAPDPVPLRRELRTQISLLVRRIDLTFIAGSSQRMKKFNGTIMFVDGTVEKFSMTIKGGRPELLKEDFNFWHEPAVGK